MIGREEEVFYDEIINTINEVSSGNFTSRVHKKFKKNEFNLITIGFNMLLEEIEDLFDQIKSCNVELQKKVINFECCQVDVKDFELRNKELMKEVDSILVEHGEKPKYFK